MKQILRNPTYLGHLVFGRMPTALYLGKPDYKYEPDESKWRVLRDMHEPLVTQEVFDRVKEMAEQGQAEFEVRMAKSAEYRAMNVPLFHGNVFCGDCGSKMAYHRNQFHPERMTGSYDCNNYRYLLRSLVRCGVCGRVMTRHKKGSHTPAYYYCEKNRFVEDSPCPTYERIYEEDLERIVIGSLSQLLQTVADSDRRVQEAAAKTHGTAENIRYSLLRIEQSIKQNGIEKMAAYEQYSDGNLTRDGFLRRRSELAADMERLTAEKDALSEQLKVLEQAKSSELHEAAEAATEFLKAENVTNDMLLTFIDRVLVYAGNRVEIVYRFSDPFMETLTEIQQEVEVN